MGRLAAALLLALLGGAAAQRGDRNVNAGQQTHTATDKCTFVYKARLQEAGAPPPPAPAPAARPDAALQGKKASYTYKLMTKARRTASHFRSSLRGLPHHCHSCPLRRGSLPHRQNRPPAPHGGGFAVPARL